MSALRRAGMATAAAGLLGALVWALWPQPVQVDLARAERGPMQGVIAAQGVTRVREPYAITAPITGTLARSPVEVGDPVVAGETVVAEIRPPDPAFMDARSRAQAEAAVVEAEAAVALADTNRRQAETQLAHATQEYERGKALAARGTIPQTMLDDLAARFETAGQTLAAAQSQLDLNRAALLRAQAQLLGPGGATIPFADGAECCLRILAPQGGIVLEVADESARLVQAGAPLLTLGDLDDMEIELDLLSTDAVQVPPGARAEIDRWGGAGLLEARLRRIDPAAFTRISALGIEEQRVRLWLDLLTPPEARPGLGEGFRVHVRLIVWEASDLLQVPQAALFRQGDGWAAFVRRDGRASLTPVTVGRQSEGRAEIVEGLAEGDEVVIYPASTLTDGATITERQG